MAHNLLSGGMKKRRKGAKPAWIAAIVGRYP